nr:putative cyclic nucleotide-regulated ion channel protein [Arabidopsis thaliana]
MGVDGKLKSVRGRLKKVYGKMKTLENWRKTVLLACVVALAIDPLFLFIPLIDSQRFCFTFDKTLVAVVCVIRTFIDTFYVIHIIYYLITETIAPRSQASLRGEIVVHSKATLKTRLLFHFIVDIISVLPIPQVVVLTLIPLSASLVSERILKWIILSQYVPRIIRMYPLYKEVTRAFGTVAESKWAGAALNLFLYMLHSYVFGAFWYLSSIERKSKCWRAACARTSDCNLTVTDLLCKRAGSDNIRFLNTSCPLIDPAQITNSTDFDFGMYIDALKSGVLEVKPKDFPRKFVYCFWWGLRNISALGQNLETSNSAGEIFFAIIICVSGLLLFAVLIGNVQKYLQSSTTRVDEMEEKRRDTEKWMSYRVIPEYLKERIRRFEDYKWRETKGTEEEALLRSLPKDLRLETKRYLYLDMLKRVPWLNIMDDGWLLEAVCDRVKSVFYLANSFIVREGHPVEEMLIVTRGKLKSTTGSHEMGVRNNCCDLQDGDICGELLFNGSRLPTSTRTVMTLTEVEGFILLPDDIKFIASHLNVFQRQKLQRTFRLYSQQWRSWAAFFIQAAWRKHCKRKLSKTRDNENIPQGTQLNLASTLYVSRFVSKALQNRRKDTADCSSSPDMSPPVPHKPADLEFAKAEA